MLNCGGMTPDVASVEHLARLRLCLRRAGFDLRLANVSEELQRVIDLAGLAETLGVEVQWEAEKREQPGRVEEERDLTDPPA